MWKPTRLNWQEPSAYVATTATVAASLYSALACHRDWLSQAGSLIIVYGVLLAFTRKYDIVHAKMIELLKVHRRAHPAITAEALTRKLGRPPTCDEVRSAEATLYAEVAKDIEEVIQERRRVLKLHEVSLVVAGTLLNGFGQVLFALFQRAA